MKKFFKNAKTKASLVVAGVAGATNSFGAVTVGADGTLTGSLDMAGYNSALTIVIGATIAIVIGGIILRTIKKV